MQIEHMEVDLPETNQRQTVGPLFSGLNVISGPPGSGKTRLTYWLRQVLADNQLNPIGRQHILPGRVDLRNQGRLVRLTQDQDGRVLAQQMLHSGNGHLADVALTTRQRQAIDLLASASQAQDTQANLDEAAVRLGLESPAPQSLHANARDQWVSRESELVSRLSSTSHLPDSRDELLSRRRDIEYRLNVLRQQSANSPAELIEMDRDRLVSRYAAIEADLRGAVAEIEQYDRQLAEIKAQLKLSEIEQQTSKVESSYRTQLQQLEDRLNRWRQTLRDIKSHRESLDHDETDAELDLQVGSQISGSLHADPRAPMRSLEAQIHNARKQLDQLVQQYGSNPSLPQTASAHVSTSGPQVHRDSLGQTHIRYEALPTAVYDPGRLPEMLRSMQRDLQEICHHLSRHESNTTAQALKHQVQQLRRCETELLQSVQLLIAERGILLRKIADRYNLTSDQLSLAFGQWCQCNDHQYLYDWLLKDEVDNQPRNLERPQSRMQLLDTLARLESQRKEASMRAEECRRQLREAERNRLPVQSTPEQQNHQTLEAEMLRELDVLQLAMSDWENRDRWQAELDEVRRQLALTPSDPVSVSDYRQAVNRHIVGLSGTLHHQSYHQHGREVLPYRNGVAYPQVANHSAYAGQYPVPDAIVRVAQRLAIAQALAVRGDTIPVWLDQSLDGTQPDLQRAAVEYLARVAQRQQILILTDDQRVVDLVRQHRGRVHTLQSQQLPVREAIDINQVLSGFANAHEADMWDVPALGLDRDASGFYLYEHSPIEDHPTLNPTITQRCRSLGVHRIADLLSAQADWLAEQLMLPQVSEVNVSNWQAVAELLCCVRNLRPFDARVLVGAGIRNSTMLSQMHPTKLVDRVERFLTTDVGRKIVTSGTIFELSRINNWIAAARRGATSHNRNRTTGRNVRADRPHVFSQLSSETTVSPDHERTPEYDDQPHYRQQGTRPRSRATSGRHPSDSRSERSDRDHSASHQRNPQRSDRPARLASGRQERSKMRYYLELSSPVVDAPSIGNRMAERLHAEGVNSVEQLLKSGPDSLASRLGLQRVTGATVRSWQDQSRLVCRIPNLRGHDAQMLVACGLTTPESLTAMNPEKLLSQVLAYAQSSEGQRVLRGSPAPDLDEVVNWISWAGQSRSLNAA
jgi:hypothetical protein